MPAPKSGKRGANQPRERMLRQLEDQFPGMAPVVRMVEQAEKVRQQIIDQEDQHDADLVLYADGKLETVTAVTPLEQREMLLGMYDKIAKYLVPRLKETEIKSEQFADVLVKTYRDTKRRDDP